MSLYRLPAALAALALLASLSACGNEQSTTSRLRDDTAAVVTALNAKNLPAARKALDILDADLVAAGRLGQLDSATVETLQQSVSALRADLALLAPKPTPSPTRVPTVPPQRSGGKDDDDEKGKGHKDD